MRLSASVYLLIAFLACFGTARTHAQEQSAGITEISVCGPESTWRDAANVDTSGHFRDIIKAVFVPLGVKINLTFMPYKISIARVREKACDIALGGYTNEYSDLLYSQWPSEIESVTVVHASGAKFEDQRSFVGKKIAWLQGYGFEIHLPANIDYTEVRSEALGLRMLERGRLDYFLDYAETITSAAAQIGIDLEAYTLSPVPALSQPVYSMFTNDARGRSLVNLHDSRMAELHKDGTLDRIFEKYGLGLYPAPLTN
jgi:polar amino acid transport system substrate-binding protein